MKKSYLVIAITALIASSVPAAYSAGTVTELTLCKKLGDTGKTSKGVVAKCVKMPDGKLVWATAANDPHQKASGGSSNSSGSPTNGSAKSASSLSNIFSGGKCQGTSTKLTDGFADPAKMSYIYPLGGMISSHITPIDHIYIYYPQVVSGPVLIKSPAAGNVVLIEDFNKTNEYPYADYRVVIEHSCNLYSVFIHVGTLTGKLATLKSKIGNSWQGRFPIASGEVFSDDTEHPGFDYSIFDQTKKLSGFANPAAYQSGDPWKLWTADPLQYLPSSVNAAYKERYIRTAEPIGGKIDWDVKGTPLGNWFVKGSNWYQGLGSKMASYNNHGRVAHGYWDTHLAIAPDAIDPSAWIFSVGDYEGCPCQFMSNDPSIDPRKISVDSGVVVIELVNPQMVDGAGRGIDPMNPPKGYRLQAGTQIEGLLALQLNRDNTLTVEKVPGAKSKSEFKGFSQAAVIYTR